MHPIGRPPGALNVDHIISADDHMDLNVVPPTLFHDRLPARLRDGAPRVEATEQGPGWCFGGRRIMPSGSRGPRRAGNDRGYRPGIAEQRLEDMDLDGIYAQIIYGPPTGFDFIAEPDLRAACYRAYNDWASEFSAVAPDRLAMLGILPSHDPEVATEELLRVAGLDLHGAIVGLFESPNPVFTESWDRLWAAANETELPLHYHLSGGLHSLRSEPGTWRQPALVSAIPMQLDEALVGTIFAGIFERHPRVRLVLGESGLGWIPYLLERMDHEHEKYAAVIADPLVELPSTYFKNHVFVTYEQDDLGLTLFSKIGVQNVMWASDYPHGDSTWPKSREIVATSLQGLRPETQQAILWSNASALYSIMGPP